MSFASLFPLLARPSAGLHASALAPVTHNLELPLQVPVGLPTGVSPEQAKGVIDYLKSNPEAAERHYMEAQRVLGQPGMASVIQAQQQAQQSPAYQQQLAQLRWDVIVALCTMAWAVAFLCKIWCSGTLKLQGCWLPTPWQLGSSSCKVRKLRSGLCCALMLAVCARLNLGPFCPAERTRS